MSARVNWHGDEVLRRVEAHVKKNLLGAAIVVARQAKANARKGGDDNLHRRTGTLIRSIMHEVEGFTARVGTNLKKYARIHELGGVIKPKTAKALHFVIDGKHIMTQKVTMPARPYLRPALDMRRAEVAQWVGRPIPGTGL